MGRAYSRAVLHFSAKSRPTVPGRWILTLLVSALSPQAPCPAPRALLLLGTAFSFVHLLDYLAERNLRFDLPAGSRVMETGGYKNRSRSMSKTELHRLITGKLGIPSSRIICEYGMSEMSSQAYDSAFHLPSSIIHHRVFQFPPWARVQIISPETGREVADGETGLIRVFDLANVFSVMAVQTEDLGIRRDGHFELIGRAALAEPRGCSLMMLEEVLRHFPNQNGALTKQCPPKNDFAQLFSRRFAAGGDAVAGDDHGGVPDAETQSRAIPGAAFHGQPDRSAVRRGGSVAQAG